MFKIVKTWIYRIKNFHKVVEARDYFEDRLVQLNDAHRILMDKHESLWIDHKRQRGEIIRLNNVIEKYEKGNVNVPVDLQAVFEAHRRAARQSIDDAYEAEQRYKRKLNEQNPGSTSL